VPLLEAAYIELQHVDGIRQTTQQTVRTRQLDPQICLGAEPAQSTCCSSRMRTAHR